MVALLGRHQKWINKAITVAATKAEGPQWFLGAVIVKSNRVLSVGWNRDQNDPANLDMVDIKRGKASTHAEIDAIAHCGDTHGATIYVGRILRSGGVGPARPCSHCLTNIETSGIKSVWWTDYNGKYGNIKL